MRTGPDSGALYVGEGSREQAPGVTGQPEGHNQNGRASCSTRKVENPGLDCSVERAEEAS